MHRHLFARAAGLCAALLALSLCAEAQVVRNKIRIATCRPQTAIEFIAPMPTEHVPIFHGASPTPESWHVILEVSTEQIPGVQITPVNEGLYQPSPGAAVFPPTDVNGDTRLGDAHPGIPGLTLSLSDDLLHIPTGIIVPAGTNLASLFEMLGSEVEHGGDQSISVSWIVDPLIWMLIDIDGNLLTTLNAAINGKRDSVTVAHFPDPISLGVLSSQNPTISIWTEDWISTVDADVPADGQTAFLVGVEVRIPCFFDTSTTPPTPVPLDPLVGGCGSGPCTGFFPPLAGPGPHPAFPSLDVRFSDTYFDPKSATTVPGGTITGGACGVIWGSTGGNLAFAFQQASVHSWFGLNGVPDTTPLGGGDDQLIYRFTMLADGVITDTDVLPNEMLITAAIESTTNCFSITNVRVKHRPQVVTPNHP